MADSAPTPVHLKDYRIPDFQVDDVDLVIDLRDDGATVSARLAMRRNPGAGRPDAPLVLDGVGLELRALALDGEPLGDNRYSTDAESLTVHEVPDAFVLDTVTGLAPHENTALTGLYTSGGNFVTQCEAEGFRRITYFPDRPDVLSRYTTTIVADKARYPVLLGNGNPVDRGDAMGGRHWAKWHDPVPKPSYLFAIVAGDLVAHEDVFVTRSGRRVALAILVRRGDLDQCAHAMHALKAAMAWDEETYGLEYDLDVFNIVAVPDFNMGAMENKGLNVFNTALLLARPDTATDADYQRIEGVVAHEYFHNWTGNRITCRDWFQLSLKEGLTVFRDQQFQAGRGSPAVKRIQDVRRLRASQFPEDGGPMAHPVRPESYIEINNFYTPTVYEKGAEVIRMMHTLLGADRFRAGMDLYVRRYDIQAVTCEDFVHAMEHASGVDLVQFRRWYSQAGTPHLAISDTYDEAGRTYILVVRQYTPATPGQPVKEALHIPVAVGLLDRRGNDIPCRLEGEAEPFAGTRVLEVREGRQVFQFSDVPERPVPSLLRGFSAPVKLKPQPRYRLKFLFVYDTDPFARWEAGQQLVTQLLLDMVRAFRHGEAMALDPEFVEAYARVLAEADGGDAGADEAFIAETLTLPSPDFLADHMMRVDVEAIHAALDTARAQLAATHRAALLAAYRVRCDAGPYRIDPQAMGRRALKNLCLELLAARAEDEEALALTVDQFRGGGNMTDVLAALAVLSHRDRPERDEAFAAFYERWREHPTVVDKWFTLQARSRLPDTLERVRALLDHPAFDTRVPNRVRSLVGAFALGNPLRFHAADGGGYAFLTEQVLAIDRLNPQLAARLVAPLGRWRRHDENRQAKMKASLSRILDAPALSKDVFEIASKSLS